MTNYIAEQVIINFPDIFLAEQIISCYDRTF